MADDKDALEALEKEAKEFDKVGHFSRHPTFVWIYMYRKADQRARTGC